MTVHEQLERDEGRRLLPYRDSLGFLTIGVGRNLDTKGLSDAEVSLLLDHDIADAQVALADAAPWSAALDEPRRGVLVNMAFNLGLTGLLGFRRMLRACQAGDYAGAAREMRASRWATQVGDRAERLATQMETGVWV